MDEADSKRRSARRQQGAALAASVVAFLLLSGCGSSGSDAAHEPARSTTSVTVEDPVRDTTTTTEAPTTTTTAAPVPSPYSAAPLIVKWNGWSFRYSPEIPADVADLVSLTKDITASPPGSAVIIAESTIPSGYSSTGPLGAIGSLDSGRTPPAFVGGVSVVYPINSDPLRNTTPDGLETLPESRSPEAKTQLGEIEDAFRSIDPIRCFLGATADTEHTPSKGDYVFGCNLQEGHSSGESAELAEASGDALLAQISGNGPPVVIVHFGPPNLGDPEGFVNYACDAYFYPDGSVGLPASGPCTIEKG